MRIIILFLIIFSTSVTAKSKKSFDKKEFSKVVKSVRTLSPDDWDLKITRSVADSKIDDLIEARLGDDYRRANVYDFFPMELPRSKTLFRGHDDQVELIDYYNYARRNLEYLSQSKLLKTFELDFDLDKTKDRAIIVLNKKKNKPFLAILNNKETLYLEPFLATHLEQINEGRYPFDLVYELGEKTKVMSPCLRLVDFDEEHSQALFFDISNHKWQSYDLLK